MRLLKNLKIDYQRLIFRLKRKRRLNKLEKSKCNAVKEAERLKNITGKRHYVFSWMICMLLEIIGSLRK